LVEIAGQPPDLAQLPPGCPFAPRCIQRQPVCDEAYPPRVTLEDGHVADCWLAAPGRPGAEVAAVHGPQEARIRPEEQP